MPTNCRLHPPGPGPSGHQQHVDVVHYLMCLHRLLQLRSLMLLKGLRYALLGHVVGHFITCRVI